MWFFYAKSWEIDFKLCMKKRHPRKCNSAKKLSGCIQREQSVILGLPTNNLVIEIFEKTLTGGFSSVNTRLLFDTELLMPNLTERDYKKLKIEESFKAYKRHDLKVTYRIKLDNENSYHERRVISKIIKLDENNQYSFVMTKPMRQVVLRNNRLHHGSNSTSFSKMLIWTTRLDISLLSISSLTRKELLNESICTMRF